MNVFCNNKENSPVMIEEFVTIEKIEGKESMFYVVC